ncbi:MAG: Holliday junction resolvase RuvX [Anaerolineales bacterium]
MRILAVDPGQKRIGIAISDPNGKVAFPLTVIPHRSKQEDAQNIIALAEQYHVDLILIGQALGIEQQPTVQSRRSANLAMAIGARTNIPIVLYDEFETTRIALDARRKMGVTIRKRKSNLDSLAAAVLLQNYIDNQAEIKNE